MSVMRPGFLKLAFAFGRQDRILSEADLKGHVMASGSDTIERREVDTDEAFEILQRALEHPGIREVMAVYRKWQTIEYATRAYCQAVIPRTAMAVADTSVPSTLRCV
jgi:hypothetical protein